MAEESQRKEDYVSFDKASDLPSRYTRQPRGGKRRQTTIAKRERSQLSLDLQNIPNVESEGGQYKIYSSDDSNDSSVDEDYEVDSIASSIEDSLTWRGRMQVSVHSAWFHIIIVLLVVADALIVIFELLLDVGAFGNLECMGETKLEQKEFCHFSTQGKDCSPPAILILERINISASPGGKGDDGLCTCNFRNGRRVCTDSEGSAGVNPGLVLHIASLIILTVFVIEIIVKLIAFRLKYFTHKFEVFDGCIVVLSYALDLASLKEEEAFEAASLVILLRLWRVVRIVNGAVLSAKSRSDQQLDEARLKARTIIHAFHKAQDKLDALEIENRKLQKDSLKAQAKLVQWPRGNKPTPVREETEPLIVVVKPDKEGSEEVQEESHEQKDDLTGSMPEIVVTEPEEGSDV